MQQHIHRGSQQGQGLQQGLLSPSAAGLQREKQRVSRAPAAREWPGAQGAGSKTSPDHPRLRHWRTGAWGQGQWELLLWGQLLRPARLGGKLVLKWDTYLAQLAGSQSCPSKSKKTRLTLMVVVGGHNDPEKTQLVGDVLRAHTTHSGLC